MGYFDMCVIGYYGIWVILQGVFFNWDPPKNHKFFFGK